MHETPNYDMEWDEEKYKLLNAHFRQKINQLLQTDPVLAKSAAEGKSIQLSDLVASMTEQDQKLWQEFLILDRIKLNMDLKDHLEGRGTPYNPRTRFGDHAGSEGGLDTPW